MCMHDKGGWWEWKLVLVSEALVLVSETLVLVSGVALMLCLK